MDISDKLQDAIKSAIQCHDVLGQRAFAVDSTGQYVLKRDVLTYYYSETEGMVLGLLMEIYHEVHGLSRINLPERMTKSIDRPSQLVWKGAPHAFKIINRLDRGQREIFSNFFTS